MKKRYVNALLLGMSLCVAAPGTAVSASEIPAQESAVEDTSDAELEAIMREAEAAAAGADGTEESGSDGSATEETKYAAKLTEVVETLEQKVSAGGSAMSKEDVSILKSFFESISPEDNFATVSDFLSFVLSSYSDQGIDGDDSHVIKPSLDKVKEMKHQILSTTKQGKVGTEVLNRTLEDPADADSLIYHDYVYRAGDKVVFVSNNYKAGYCNGDVGVITEIHNGMTVSLGDETVSLGEYDLDEILPADVITVHKSQGGEYEDVYVMLPEKPRVLLTRNILNTAVSRARKKVMLFTVRNSLSICVSNVMSHNRDTWLSIFFQQDN